MDQFLLYSVIFVSFISLIVALIAGVRVGNFMKSTEQLDWSSVANITGDLATLKKTIQTLNNRISGINIPRINDEQMIQQFMQQQQTKPNGKLIGG